MLSVSFTPTDTTHYNPASATVSLTVNKATPTITWATPAAITHGTALSATQLDATASVPGSVVYTAARRTVLNAGAGQTLSVSFTPTDAANYTTATQTVVIDVVDAAPTVAPLGNVATVVGASVALQVQATVPTGSSLAFSATGLP